MTIEEIIRNLKIGAEFTLSRDDSEKLNIYVNHLEQIIRRLDKERDIVYECSRIIREKL